MTEQINKIPARLKNMAKNGHVAGADDIIDDVLDKTQDQVNQDLIGADQTEKNRAESAELALRNAVGGLTQSKVIVGALPASGATSTIYRVPGTNSYSDYAWNGSQFVLMATYNNAIDDVPISGSTNLITSGAAFDVEKGTYMFYNISADSPYYVDKINGAWMSGGAIKSNQYTGPYIVYLFRVPAGLYKFIPVSQISASTIFVGTIDSINDFVVNGTISNVLLQGDATTEKFARFENETLLCVLSYTSSYNRWCYVYSGEPVTEITQVALDRIENSLSYTQNGLLGVKKGTELVEIQASQNIGDNISPKKFSQFFLDMKIVGDVEQNTEYMFDYFQQKLHGTEAYSNYIRISKSSDNWATKTTVVGKNIGTDMPTGMLLYELIPTSSTLEKIYLLLNWDALLDVNAGAFTATFASYNIPVCYKFDMSYLQNMEYGIIPNIISYRSIEEVPYLKNDVENLKKVAYVPVNLGYDSPYYVDKISNAWMNGGKITRNPYTGPYLVALFRLPAGDYLLNASGILHDSTVTCVGSIESESDFVVGGNISQTYLSGSYTPVNMLLTLREETLVVMIGGRDNFNYYAAINELEDKEWNEKVIDIFNVNLDIAIPDIVYAIVGTELNIWNDTVALSVDKGLSSPVNYSVMWSCNKGLVTDRCFRYTPVAGDVGNVSCTCYIYDVRGVLITSKQFTIKVVAKNALSSSKNIVYFGDSLGQAAATALYDNFHNNSIYTGTIPNMLGTVGATKHCEAVGGYGWRNYATAGTDGYRINVTGVTSMSVGAVYSDGSHDFQVYEVNITNGTGNCLLGKYYTNMGALIMPSGTLTKISGSGDTSVPYTGAYRESANPLWNDTTQQLDIAQYKQTLVNVGQLPSTSAKIDAVSFQFGINDNNLANDLSTLKGYITDLYNAFIGDNANCKFIVGLTTSSGNDVNGAGVNHGAAYDTNAYLKNTYTIRKYYMSLLSEFPNMRIATPNLYLDRYYGYGFSTRQISSRYTETVQYHNNFVHPASSGYAQMGDAYLAAYVAVLSE